MLLKLYSFYTCRLLGLKATPSHFSTAPLARAGRAEAPAPGHCSTAGPRGTEFCARELWLLAAIPEKKNSQQLPCWIILVWWRGPLVCTVVIYHTGFSGTAQITIWFSVLLTIVQISVRTCLKHLNCLIKPTTQGTQSNLAPHFSFCATEAALGSAESRWLCLPMTGRRLLPPLSAPWQAPLLSVLLEQLLSQPREPSGGTVCPPK